MIFFIGSAFADATQTSQSSGLMSFAPMIFFIGIIYFLMIRPQQKRAKQHQALLASIKKGDKVVTNSGILATVVKVVNDNEIILEIANGVHVKFVKSTISNVIDPKNTTPTNLNESTKSVKKIEKINDKHETVEKTEENNNENKESSVIIDDKK